MKSVKSPGANALVQVRTRDHCPPHVHAVNSADSWEARVKFSYVDDHVHLLDVTPVANEPRVAIIRRLLADVRDNVEKFRKDWWEAYAKTCLINKWVKVSKGGELTVLKRKQRGALQVQGSAYDHASGAVSLHLSDGSLKVIMAGEGVEQ